MEKGGTRLAPPALRGPRGAGWDSAPRPHAHLLLLLLRHRPALRLCQICYQLWGAASRKGREREPSLTPAPTPTLTGLWDSQRRGTFPLLIIPPQLWHRTALWRPWKASPVPNSLVWGLQGMLRHHPGSAHVTPRMVIKVFCVDGGKVPLRAACFASRTCPTFCYGPITGCLCAT